MSGRRMQAARDAKKGGALFSSAGNAKFTVNDHDAPVVCTGAFLSMDFPRNGVSGKKQKSYDFWGSSIIRKKSKGPVVRQNSRGLSRSLRLGASGVNVPAAMNRLAGPAARVTVGFAAAMFVQGAAQAQPLGVDTPESLLLRPETQGVRVNGVVVYPRIEFDLEHDTNIYNTDTFEVEDTVFVARPSVAVQPDLDRHQIRLEADALIRRYFDTTTENSDQWAVGARGRLDFAERTAAYGSLRYAQRIESRGTFGDQFLTDEPISYDVLEARASVERTGGMLELRGGGNWAKVRYDPSTLNGEPLPNTFRDEDTLGGFVRADYRATGRLRTFVELNASQTDYTDDPIDAPRDSDGFGVLVGVRSEVSDLIDAEAAVGFAHRSFEDPTVDDFNGFNFRVSGRWTPTPRWLFGLEGARSFERSPLIEVPAVLQTRLRAVAQRSLGRRLLAGVEVTYDNWDYQGIDRQESRFGGELTLRYLVFDQLTALAGAGYRKQTGSGDMPREYEGASFRVGLAVSL